METRWKLESREEICSTPRIFQTNSGFLLSNVSKFIETSTILEAVIESLRTLVFWMPCTVRRHLLTCAIYLSVRPSSIARDWRAGSKDRKKTWREPLLSRMQLRVGLEKWRHPYTGRILVIRNCVWQILSERVFENLLSSTKSVCGSTSSCGGSARQRLFTYSQSTGRRIPPGN